MVARMVGGCGGCDMGGWMVADGAGLWKRDKERKNKK